MKKNNIKSRTSRNQRLLEIIDDETENEPPPRESWISKNRAEK